ncbi:extracellular solute-binding protein [Herbivorax sp. ANBcel31]|uniref:ABC transporter substrate-binding protein n=1 Tax=Herbivorax sp. ANBcel31 TaxID=3069754 RepID=UPI0027B1FA6B|nr:extracellular solute-binding protein [Herbivorax sp. ANBcel31]MDQ2087459.1 extracellular solute-binding protein [Herbivorax sp. ANBcel31]
MRKYFCLLLTIFIILSTSCSKYQDNSSTSPARPGQGVDTPDQSDSLEDEQTIESENLIIWSFYDVEPELKSMIDDALPNTTVDYEIIPFFKMSEKYTSAFNDGDLPDVFIFSSASMSNFNSTNAFVDLSASPYNAKSMLSDYPKHLKPVFNSFDNQKLLALPVKQIPGVTFYRHDIIEEAGFPAEPEELAVYMEDIDNWLRMAKTFKESGRHIVLNSYDFLLYADLSCNLFDENFNFMRNSDIFIDMMELGKTIDKHELASNDNLIEANDNNSFQTGKTIMFQSSMLDVNSLKEATNGMLDGKWRMTRLPFGLFGWAGSAIATIPAQSQNKEAAWKAIEILSNNHIEQLSYIMNSNNVTNVYSDPLFGDQDIDKLYKTLIDKMPEYQLTPLDEKARIIWWEEWFDAYSNPSTPSATIVNNLHQRVIEELDNDIEIVKKSAPPI